MNTTIYHHDNITRTFNYCWQKTFVSLTKLPAMVLAWENLQEVFVMLVVVVFLPHWRFLRFRATFPSHQTLPWLLRSMKASTSSEVYTGYFCLLYFFHHSFTVRATVLSGRFLPRYVSYLALLPHILTHFCDSDAGRNTPSRILLCDCPHRVVPSGWHVVLNYSYCR